MENIKLTRVKNQLKSAPPCPSWNPDSTPVQPKNSFVKSAMSQLKCSSNFNRSQRRDVNPIQPKNSFVRNNRTSLENGDIINNFRSVSAYKMSSPHLKYGLFTNRPSMQGRRNECTLLKHRDSPQAKLFMKPVSPTSMVPQRRSSQDRQETNRILRSRLGVSPVLFYQPSGGKLEHRLSLSEVMHVDIKPAKKNTLSFAHFLHSSKFATPSRMPR